MSILQISKGAIASSCALSSVAAWTALTDQPFVRAIGAAMLIITQSIYGPTDMSSMVIIGGYIAYTVLQRRVQLLPLLGVYLASLALLVWAKGLVTWTWWMVGGGVVFLGTLWYTETGSRLLKQLREGKPS